MRMLLLVAERLARGRRQYGTLDVAADWRCFAVEALKQRTAWCTQQRR